MKDLDTKTTATNIVIKAATAHRKRAFRFCLFSRFSFSSTTREPLLHRSPSGSTLTSGVPSVRQNANKSSAE